MSDHVRFRRYVKNAQWKIAHLDFWIMCRFTYSVYSYTRWTVFGEWNNHFRSSNRSVELNPLGLNQRWYFECLLSCHCLFFFPFPLWLITVLWWPYGHCVNENSTQAGLSGFRRGEGILFRKKNDLISASWRKAAMTALPRGPGVVQAHLPAVLSWNAVALQITSWCI